MLDQNWRYWCEFIGIQCICRNLWKYGCQSLYVCIYVFIYTYSLALSPESAWEQWYRNSTGYTRYPDLGFYSPFSARRNQGSLRKVYFKVLCREHTRWVVPGKTSRFFWLGRLKIPKEVWNSLLILFIGSQGRNTDMVCHSLLQWTNTLATWYKELTHWKRPWLWERLRAGEGDNRGWDGWKASLTQQT